ncbi:Isoprenylcysteine carboxyl methyltransferase, partial [Globisporangium splendens]
MFRSVQFTSDKGLGKVAVAAFGLGFAMALHVALLAYAYLVGPLSASAAVERANAHTGVHPDALYYARWECLALWCLYVIALCFFHLSEFMVTASFRPSIVSYESFLLNHSREYHIALAGSCVEFWLEFYLTPAWKVHTSVLVTGLVIVCFGQSFRIAAMATAASNFSHRIEYQKRQEHVLVTHGVYKYVRHPSYLGWFAWTIGSQVLLGNPVCGIGYTIVSWGFFRDRIPYEEHLLLNFFPEEYPKYKARTISGIPFV